MSAKSDGALTGSSKKKLSWVSMLEAFGLNIGDLPTPRLQRAAPQAVKTRVRRARDSAERAFSRVRVLTARTACYRLSHPTFVGERRAWSDKRPLDRSAGIAALTLRSRSHRSCSAAKR